MTSTTKNKFLSSSVPHTLIGNNRVIQTNKETYSERIKEDKNLYENINLNKNNILFNLFCFIKDKNVVMLHQEAIVKFFDQNEELISIFFDMIDELKLNFHEDQILLDISRENQEPDYSCLLIIVRQDSYQKNIEDKLDEIYENFSGKFVNTNSWILITTDYQNILSFQ